MTASLDVLVVGAGPTGLALAAQLRSYGTGFRLADRSPWPGVAQALVRPDGHLGYVARGADLDGLRAYAARWLPVATA
ncbi:FAD-dependent monooxygenase [Streptomyces sp. NPDC048564]|uniref:FAD-dependent monooxygenase n=1 Tax=Streptomyces sp. NPDC048564 TaxID=3155760 RepID=UPI003441758D